VGPLDAGTAAPWQRCHEQPGTGRQTCQRDKEESYALGEIRPVEQHGRQGDESLGQDTGECVTTSAL